MRRLVFLMTAMAVALGFASTLDGPWLLRVTMGIYLVVLVGWAIMRWPNIWAAFMQTRARGRALEEGLQQFSAEARAKRDAKLDEERKSSAEELSN